MVKLACGFVKSVPSTPRRILLGIPPNNTCGNDFMDLQEQKNAREMKRKPIFVTKIVRV